MLLHSIWSVQRVRVQLLHKGEAGAVGGWHRASAAKKQGAMANHMMSVLDRDTLS